MNNLKIAIWNLKDNKFRLNKNSIKIKIIKELLMNNDLDVLALQNVDRKLSLKLNEDLNSMGYHFDHIKEEGMTRFDEMFGREKNPVIVKNNYMNVSDIVATDGILVNRVFCKNASKKFYVFNSYLANDEISIDMFNNVVRYTEIDMYGKAPIIIAGNFEFDSNNKEIAKINKYTLKYTCNCDKDYLMLSDHFDVDSHEILKDLVPSDMNKPLLVKTKIK